MIVKKTDNKIEILFKYDPATVSFVRTLENRTYNAGTKSWFIPLANSMPSLERLAGQGFTIDTDLVAEAMKDKKTAQEAEALALMPDTEFTTPLPLFPYQKVGASFLCQVGSGLLGDQPGCGKTVQVLAVAEHQKAEKVLIFCPAVLKYQWASEIEKFLPGSKVVVVDGSGDNRIELWRTEARFYIANYELLLRDFDAMNVREWDYIFADECTKIQNPSAKTSKRIKRLRSRNRIGMSGTPISNAAQNIWNIIDFCQPGAMGDYWGFIQRYCVKNQWGGIFKYQNMDELRGKLKRHMIRRLKADVLPELPERIDSDITFVLSEEEAELQKRIKKEILYEINKEDISKLETPMTLQFTIVKFGRLRQLADSLELLGDNKKSTKLEVLKELLEQFRDTDQKILIFSEFSEMCKILHRELQKYRPVMIIGETPNEERKMFLKEFNDDSTRKVFILSSAGQFGLNITAASVVINYDLPFSLAKIEQRIGRAHRYGQKKKVMVYNLLGKGTADMGIRKILHAKAELSDQLLGDKVSMEQIKDILTYE